VPGHEPGTMPRARAPSFSPSCRRRRAAPVRGAAIPTCAPTTRSPSTRWGRSRARRTPVTGRHLSLHTPAQPRSHARTARVAPEQTPGPTTACPGSIGPRAQVRRETRTSPTTAIPRSLVDGSRGSRPSPQVSWRSRSTLWGRAGPVPSLQRAGPVVAQDGSHGRTRRVPRSHKTLLRQYKSSLRSYKTSPRPDKNQPREGARPAFIARATRPTRPSSL
jgi:hypothetical protein